MKVKIDERDMSVRNRGMPTAGKEINVDSSGL